MKFYASKPCHECEGTGRVWIRGAHYQTLGTCGFCLGLCYMQVEITPQEALVIAQKACNGQ